LGEHYLAILHSISSVVTVTIDAHRWRAYSRATPSATAHDGSAQRSRADVETSTQSFTLLGEVVSWRPPEALRIDR
jgi:hypothetical protein